MTKTTEAIKWIEAVNAGNGLANVWRLEILEKRLKTKKGEVIPEEKQPPFKIRRFLKGVPAGYVAEVIKYLHATSPYEGIIFNGEKLAGKWRLTRTTWRRDEQTTIDRGQMVEGTYTLIQDLTEDSEAADSLDTLTESSCSVEQTSEYVWDAADVEDIEHGSQGETWSIRNVGRNEDGTYNYVKVHTRALTQHAGEVVATKNAYETVYTDSWNNVYGYPPDFHDENGNKVTLPEETENLKVQVSENDDCTYRISIERREPIESKTTETSCERTQFEHDDSTVTRAQDSGLGEAPAASGGVVTSHKSELREDGKYDNTVRTKKELHVSGSEETWTVGLTGIVHKVTDTQTSSPGTKPTFSRENIGKTVSNTKTPGGRYNVSTTSIDRTSGALDVGAECEQTVFEHTHSKTVSDPSGKIDIEDTEPASGGKTHHVSARMNDDGSSTTVTRDTEELPRKSAVVEYRKTLRGTSVSVTDRNASTPVTQDELKVGETRRSETTPGGLYNNTVTTVSTEDSGTIGLDCRKSIFEHVHEKTVNQSQDPGDEVSEAGDGSTHQQSARRTEEGTWDVTTRDTTEKPVPSSTVVKRKTLRGTVTSTTDSNTTDGVATVSKIGDEVRVEKTPGGRYNKTTTSILAEEAGVIAKGGQRTIFEETDETTTNQSSDDGEVSSAGGGNIYQRTSRQTEEGSWDVTERTTKELPVHSSRTVKKVSTHALVTTTVNTNGTDSTTDGVTKSSTPGSEQQVDKTPGGRFTKSRTTVEPTDFKKWDAVVDTNFQYLKTVWFINATQSDYQAIIDELGSLCESKSSSWANDDRYPSSCGVTPSISLNEVGRYDGNVAFRASWETTSAGQTGAKDHEFFNHTKIATYSSTRPDKDGYLTTKTTTVQKILGRGINKLSGYLNQAVDGTKAKVFNQDFSFRPSDGTWSFDRYLVTEDKKKASGTT